MVYNGPSKGCKACRKRRVKCDQGKPACNNCSRRKVECPGYESTFDYRHRNETNSTILRVQQREEASRRKSTSASSDSCLTDTSPELCVVETSNSTHSPPSGDTSITVTLNRDDLQEENAFGSLIPFDSLDPDPEAVVLNWYFTNYPMKSIDPQSSHGFVSLLKPLYLSSPSDSPLRPAVAAIASNLLMLFCHQGSDTDLARKFYAKSITRMKSMITDPSRSKQDDMLLTTLALNFYDTINLRWNTDASNIDNHRNGALALMKHRGASNNQNEVSRHVTSCMRTSLCNWAFENESTISPDVLEWLTEDSIPTNKASALDVICLKLIDFQSRFIDLYDLHKKDDVLHVDQAAIQDMIDEALEVDQLFANWAKSIPAHWKPMYATASDVLPSIRTAGFYGDQCAVYWDMSICDTSNVYRTRRLKILRLIRQLCLDGNGSQVSMILSSTEKLIQEMVDEQCQAVPFMIGDVVNPILHSRLYEINYPSASNDVCTYPNADHDHPRAAASLGGWLSTFMLVNAAKISIPSKHLQPFTLRKGQFEWICGQLNRMQRVFLLSQPPHRATWRMKQEIGYALNLHRLLRTESICKDFRKKSTAIPDHSKKHKLLARIKSTDLMSTPERVGSLSLSAFQNLPQKCKPRYQTDDRREWTPMSAIVVAFPRSDSEIKDRCISLATGTKCLPASQISRCRGLVLHDCHAEVLAFRGLNWWLLNEIKLLTENSSYTSDVVERCRDVKSRTLLDSGHAWFRVREDVSFYMFTTTAPCGDASMDLLISSSADQTPWSPETLASDLSGGQPLGRGHFSLLGAVRRKPARADAEATMSKSCTDKMALKQFTGLLQFPTDLFLQSSQQTFLDALVVYGDQFDKVGYERALRPDGRLSAITAKGHFFKTHTLPQDFPRFEFERQHGAKQKVSNISAVYIAGSGAAAPVQEVLVNGVKQGYKQFEDRPGKASVLCRRKMLELATEVQILLQAQGASAESLVGRTYVEMKESPSRVLRRKTKEHVTRQMGNWVSNSAEDDFEVVGIDPSMGSLS